MSTSALFKYMKRIKLIPADAKFKNWRKKRVDMLALIYNELIDLT